MALRWLGEALPGLSPFCPPCAVLSTLRSAATEDGLRRTGILPSPFAGALQTVQEGHRQRGDRIRPPDRYMLVNQALPQRAKDDAGRRQLGDRLGLNRY